MSGEVEFCGVVDEQQVIAMGGALQGCRLMRRENLFRRDGGTVEQTEAANRLAPSAACGAEAFAGCLGHARGKLKGALVASLIAKSNPTEFFFDIHGHGPAC